MIDLNTYKMLFYNSLDGMLIIENEYFIQCNDAAAKMLGYETPAQLIKIHPSNISPAMQPDGSCSEDKVTENINIAMETGYNRFEWVHWKADGSPIWIEVSLTLITTEERQVIHVVWHDIDTKKSAEERLLKSKKQVEDIINKFPIAIVRCETDNLSVGYYNHSFHKLFGWSLNDISTMDKWFLNAYPDDNYRQEIIYQWGALIEKTYELNLVTSPYAMEVNVSCKDGSIKICKVWYHSTFGNVFGIFYDITKQKKAENQLVEKNIELKKLSQTDGLTGLLNRVSVENAIQKEINRVNRYDQDLLSIIMFDLDHFKHVNDTYGHAEGDLVLRTVSKLIEDSKRVSDQVGRWEVKNL